MTLFLLIFAALCLAASAWLVITMPPARSPYRSRWAERHPLFDDENSPDAAQTARGSDHRR